MCKAPVYAQAVTYLRKNASLRHCLEPLNFPSADGLSLECLSVMLVMRPRGKPKQGPPLRVRRFLRRFLAKMRIPAGFRGGIESLSQGKHADHALQTPISPRVVVR